MSDTTRGSARAQFGPQAVSEAMHGQDPAAQAMGISIERVAHGLAELSMQVRPDMVDWGGHCHGGLIFSLADTAFAHACNSYNNVSLAVSCSFEYLAPARPGKSGGPGRSLDAAWLEIVEEVLLPAPSQAVAPLQLSRPPGREG